MIVPDDVLAPAHTPPDNEQAQDRQFRLTMAPIMSILHRSSATSVLSFRSGSTKISVRMANMLLPLWVLSSDCAKMAHLVARQIQLIIVDI
jgi:hypothetical protein